MLKNVSKRLTTSIKVNIARTLFDNIFGMILSKNSGGLVFKTRFGIHTFFMTKRIDIVVVDKNKTCVYLHRSLRPYRVYFWNPKFDTVVELPEGSIGKAKIEVGDELNF